MSDDRIERLCELMTTKQLQDYRTALELDWADAPLRSTRRFCRSRITAIDKELQRRAAATVPLEDFVRRGQAAQKAVDDLTKPVSRRRRRTPEG